MKLNSNNIISGNAKVLRNVNRAVILNIIRERQPISRVGIARLTGLNKSTVSSIVTLLLEEGFIYEEEIRDRNVGRNPILLRLKTDEYFMGAVSINETKTRLGITDIYGSFMSIKKIATDSTKPERFFAECIRLLDEMRLELDIKKLEGIGISIAGIVDPVNSIVTMAHNLNWENLDIGQIMRKVGVKDSFICVENDSKSAALAELWLGKHEGNMDNFVFLSVESGIGTGIVVDGKLVLGQYHAAGEFGHTTLFENGQRCACGNYGCWEAYASDHATCNRYANLTQLSDSKAKKIVLQDIIDKAKAGENDAVKALSETGYYLGLGISNILKALDPEVIIVGGRITQAWEWVHPEIMRVVSRRTFFGKSNSAKILTTSLTTRPGLVGAATLAIKELFNDYKIIT